MKIIPINQTNNAVFKGLWEKPKEITTDTNWLYINKRIDNNYHPYADELKSSIEKELKTKTFDVDIPTVNNFKIENLKSEPNIGKRLSFTKSEFEEYKNFCDKNIPETLKKIEQELVENNLSHYKNGGIIYAIKRFFH